MTRWPRLAGRAGTDRAGGHPFSRRDLTKPLIRGSAPSQGEQSVARILRTILRNRREAFAAHLGRTGRTGAAASGRRLRFPTSHGRTEMRYPFAYFTRPEVPRPARLFLPGNY